MLPSVEQQIRTWARECASDLWDEHHGDLDALTQQEAWRGLCLSRLQHAVGRPLSEDEQRVFLHEAANRLTALAALAMVP